MPKKDKAKPRSAKTVNDNRKNGKASKKGRVHHKKNPQSEIAKILLGDGAYVNVKKRWTANA